MWRQAWLKLLVCKSNFAETDGYVRPESKDSDGKQKQTIRMTSFQELCSIVLSLSEPVVRQDGIRKIETSISDVLKELSDPDESDVIQQLKELDQLSAESNGDIISDPVNDPSSSVQNPLSEQIDEASPLLIDANTEATSLSSTNTTTEARLPFSANINTKEASPFLSNTNIAAVPPLPADDSREAAMLLSAIACIESVLLLPADVSKEAAMLLSDDASMEAAWPFSDNIDGPGASSYLTDVNLEGAAADAYTKAAAESIIEAAMPLSDDINLRDTVQFPVDAHAEAALPLSACARPEGKEMPLDDQITEVNENLKEYASAFIQIAVKRFLVEKDLSQHKKVPKLQEVMHGHFVPKDATGAFQFYRRIRKMQELFKTHHADQSQKKRAANKNVTKKTQLPFLRKKIKVPFLQRKRQESDISDKKKERSSTLKLLYTVLAYQKLKHLSYCKLTESTPQRNPNHLPNDSEKPNSAWQWLEKWISHKSDIQQQQDCNLSKVVDEVDEQSDLAGSEEIKTAVAVDASISDDPNSSTKKEGDQIHTNSKGKTIQVLLSTTDTKVDSVESSSQEEAQYDKEDFGTKDNIIGSSNLSNAIVEAVTSLDNCSSEDPTNPTENKISQHVGTERKQFSVRTTRERNPTVVTRPTKGGKVNLLQVANVLATYKGKYQLLQSHLTSSAKVPEKSSANSISHESDMKIPFHDCSTQIAPEPPQGTSTDIDMMFPEVKPSEREEKCNTVTDAYSRVEMDSCKSQVILQNSNEKNTLADEAQNQLHVEESHTPTIHMKFKNAKAPEVFPSSPACSPRSALLQESHGEHLSPGAKLKKIENKACISKQPKSPLAQKGPYSCSKNDSSGRNSTEQLPKEVKSSNNRRNSFAIAKPDHDTRISNGNTIPSYMQTTESVRAKFHSDLKSMPDIQEKDNFVMKRHSLHIEHSKLGFSTNMQKSIQ